MMDVKEMHLLKMCWLLSGIFLMHMCIFIQKEVKNYLPNVILKTTLWIPCLIGILVLFNILMPIKQTFCNMKINIIPF